MNTKKEENQLENLKINIETKATKLSKQLSDDEMKVFMLGIKEFLVKVADGLFKDLCLQNQTMADLRCLAPNNRTVLYERAMIRLAEKLPPKFSLTTREIDNLSLEWKCLVLEKFSWNKYDSLQNHWGKIFEMKDEVGDKKIPIISKVVKFCLSFSEANASVERTFSQIAHIIKDRNRILPDTVNALMVTKSYIENSAPCYKQEIKADLIENVRNAYRRYSNSNKDTDLNNNEAGPSGLTQQELGEEILNKEIKCQEDKIKLNIETAKKLIEEAQTFMAENTKLNHELDKLKKRQKKIKQLGKERNPKNNYFSDT